jgi:hypothetical protein
MIFFLLLFECRFSGLLPEPLRASVKKIPDRLFQPTRDSLILYHFQAIFSLYILFIFPHLGHFISMPLSPFSALHNILWQK